MNYTQALYKNRWCDILKQTAKSITLEYLEKEIEVKINDIKEFR